VPGPAEAEPRAGRGRSWADLRPRFISAALLAPLALACLWVGQGAWAVLVMLATAGLGLEWARLCAARPARLPGLLVPLAAILPVVAATAGWPRIGVVLLAAGFALCWAVSRRWVLASGIIYVGAAGLALIWLREDAAAGRINVLFLVLVIWASDIGAYAAGRLLGGPRLAPAISPGKTWSGAAGGLLAAMAVGLAVALAAPGLPLRTALVAGALGVVSQAGDLLESAIKRRFGVKDTGRLIPGHGGLLDRLDGVLAAAPAAAVLAIVLGRGVHLWL
jgi:phosphatidate cytidylyltransferase